MGKDSEASSAARPPNKRLSRLAGRYIPTGLKRRQGLSAGGIRVADIKVVDDLEDWFDVLVVLAPAQGALSEATSLLAAHFAGRRRVYVFRPDGADGPCVSDRMEPGDSWLVHCPGGDSAQQAESVWKFMRDTKVRRPLIWLDGPGYTHVLERFSEDFKVFHAAGAGASASKTECDLVVAPSPSALEAIVTDGRWRGRAAAWTAAEGYEALQAAIRDGVNRLLAADKRLNILVLYDDTFTHIKPIQEHLSAFSKHSRHNYHYFPARHDDELFESFKDRWPSAWDLDDYDAVVWHFCLRAAHTDNIDPVLLERLAAYSGLKILFIQDDYDTTPITWGWVEQIGIQLVMTCIPAYGIAYAFPDWKPGTVEFLQTHTGFVPEDDMDRFIVPMAERKTHLAYRGRTLSYRYGSLGREKYMIGVRMKELAAERGVPADIAVDDAGRIYGDDWYRFTAGARATLASETGSHVFDFDGSLLALADQAQADGVSYDQFFAEHLADKEHHVRMNQVSPRIFEAVRLKTALVCFEGEYSNAIVPNKHYIPLKKDFSNADEVFAKLEDVAFLEAMTERAYQDIIEGGQWSHAAFVRRFDGIVASRLLRPARSELLAATVARRRRGGGLQAVPRSDTLEFSLNSGLLRAPIRRREFADLMGDMRVAEREGSTYQVPQPPAPPEDALVVRRLPTEGFYAADDGEIQLTSEGVQIRTTARPWHTGSYFVMDLSGIDFRDQHVWVRGVFKQVVGAPHFGTYNPDIARASEDAVIAMVDGEAVAYARVRDGATNVHIRNGHNAEATSCILTEATLVAAPAYEPGVLRIIQELAAEPRGGLWSEDSLTERSLQRPRPSQPPADCRVVATLPGSRLTAGSASVTIDGSEATLLAAGPPWTYGAFMEFDAGQLRLEEDYCWLRITARGVGGRLLAGNWWQSGNEIVAERVLERTDDVRHFDIPIEDARFAAVLFRKGLGDEDAAMILEQVDLLACSRYPRAVGDLLARLSARQNEATPAPEATPEPAGPEQSYAEVAEGETLAAPEPAVTAVAPTPAVPARWKLPFMK